MDGDMIRAALTKLEESTDREKGRFKELRQTIGSF